MCARSTSTSAEVGAACTASSASGTSGSSSRSVVSELPTIARSITFSSSRMLPGQS